MLAACSASSKYNKDNPSFDTATCGPFQAQFWKAMYNELTTLIQEFDCWDYVPRTPDMNVLPSTWAFKIKLYPDGRVKKFKARFCARGDRQKEGIDYFETWAPVVQWLTVQIVMILAIKLKLISVQCDITAAFIHGRITETIYVHQPRGFNCGKGDEVLRLKQILYGLKQLPCYFFHYLTERLIKQGLKASQFDPCLFMSNSLIVILYVNDILIYGKSEAEIDGFIDRLKQDEIALHKEGTAEGYLGVDIQRNGDKITLLQEGLTKRIIAALGLDSKFLLLLIPLLKRQHSAEMLTAKTPADASTTPVWLVCFCILDTVDLISLLPLINVHGILTLQSSHMKQRFNELEGI